MVVKLWMVRHGETDWNANRRFQGWTDVVLTDTGRDQARRLAESLAGVRFDSVWSSDLSRAVETARLAYSEPKADHRLRELNFGDLEGAVWDDLTPSVQAELAAFDGFTAPGGESIREFKARVLEFLDALPAGDHLVVTHGGVIRMVRRECGSDGFPGHADVVVLDWTNRARVDDVGA
ncbi:MAG: histidine phosphatase family protein [Acidimicrobiia bacterium]